MNMNHEMAPMPQEDLEIDFDQIIIDISKYYIRLIEDLQRSVDIMRLKKIFSILTENSSDNKKELRRLLQDRENFAQIRRLLSFVKYVRIDSDKILGFINQIKDIYGMKHGLSEELNHMIFEIVMGMKLPNLNLDVASYLLNKGNYELLDLNIRGVSNFDDITQEIYQEMNKLIHKKLLAAHLPPEGLTFDIKEGILKAEAGNLSYSFELTLYYNQEQKEYDWFLLSFEHKLERLTKVELLQNQLEMMGSGDTFEIKQKKVAKEVIYFELAYWKESMLHSLNPSHKFNLLILQLTNYPIFTFIERYQRKDPTLFSGLSEDDVVHLQHEPSLPSPEMILQLFDFLNPHASNNQDNTLAVYTQVNNLLIFGVSQQIKLNKLTLNNNFLEIFEEVKLIFQIYQLLCYYSALIKVIDKKDHQNIRLCCKKTKEIYQEESLLKQTNFFISIAIEENSLDLFIGNKDGKIDFLIEPFNKTVEVHKSRLKSLLDKSPSKFSEVVIFYKKILLLSVFNNLLSKENAKFQSQAGANEDNFKVVVYKSSSMHLMNIDNSVAQVQVTFYNKITFDDAAKNMTITTQVGFVSTSPHSKQMPLLKKELTMSLTPFDLKLIMKKFEFFQKQLKYKGYYDFARRNHEEHILQTDFEKPISQIGSALEQSFNILENSIIITLKPSYPISENYMAYINSREGIKLCFNNLPHKPKTFEIYDKNKLIIKYASVFESYAQLKRDIQRLESFVNVFSYSQKRLENKDNPNREYHSASIYNLSDRLSVVFLNDRAVDVLPHKYQFLQYYHDQSRGEREMQFTKKALVKELKHSLNILDPGIDLNQKKNEFFLKKEKAFQAQQNGASKDAKKMEPIFTYYSQYYVDVVAVSPWHFVLCWRSIFCDNLWNFVFSFQVVGENEVECFDIYYESSNSLEKQRISEENKIIQHFKKFVSNLAFHLQKAASKTDPHSHMNSKPAEIVPSLRIKFFNKGDFIIFVSELTQYLISLSNHLSNKPLTN